MDNWNKASSFYTTHAGRKIGPSVYTSLLFLQFPRLHFPLFYISLLHTSLLHLQIKLVLHPSSLLHYIHAVLNIIPNMDNNTITSDVVRACGDGNIEEVRHLFEDNKNDYRRCTFK